MQRLPGNRQRLQHVHVLSQDIVQHNRAHKTTSVARVWFGLNQ